MKLLALDIGGVCLNLTMDEIPRHLGVPQEFMSRPDVRAITHDFSCGRIAGSECYRRLLPLLPKPISLAEMRNAWRCGLGTENTVTTRLLEDLWAAGWNIVFLSDTDTWHVEFLREILPYSNRIPEAVYSCDVGAEKPNDAMYEAFEKLYGRPDLYLDDRLCNIEGGLRHGWNAVQYTADKAEELRMLYAKA